MTPHFYNANADSGGHVLWRLEVEEVDIDLELNGELQYECNSTNNSIVFFEPKNAIVYQVVFGGEGASGRYEVSSMYYLLAGSSDFFC